MPHSTSTFPDRLRARLGPDRVLTDPETLAGRSHDTWPLRLIQGVFGAPAPPPLCVIRPKSTSEVAEALRQLQAEGVPAVPRGGGSGVAGGARPRAGAAVLDLGHMDQILSLDEENLSVTVQAGVVLGRLEIWLNERGYICGHYPQSIGLAQVGGLIATRSSGQFSTLYGNIEDLVLGLEAVLPGGEVIRLASVPRRAAGPDLRHLWIGSEGVLGVITEATLKIFPTPAERWLQAYAFPTMALGLAAVQQIMRQGWRPAVVRLHDPMEAQRSYAGAVSPGEPILLLLAEGAAGWARAQGEGIGQTVQAAGGRPLGADPVEAWLRHRNDVSDFHRYISLGVLVDTIEVAVSWTGAAELYHRLVTEVPGAVPELVWFSGHASHCYTQGTNLYFTLAANPPQDPAGAEQVYWAIWSKAMEITLQHGGSICHHHGIGKLRSRWLPAELGSAYPLLRGLKRALDPAGLMNPGTLLREELP